MSENARLLDIEKRGDPEAARPVVCPHTSPRKSRIFQKFLLFVAALACCKLLVHGHLLPLSKHHKHDKDFRSACPQADPRFPANATDAFDKIKEYVSGPYMNYSVGYLSHAVQYPTISYDDLGKVPVNETDESGDVRWNTRFDFIDYLATSFPLLHATLKLEKVNTFGLLYTWQGSDVSLRPTMLMAHTDVVPVPAETVKQWTYPPFSGYSDGEYVWGRGASDCKNQLLAIFEAVTILVEQGFEPARTIVLSFGFDEEISGGQGGGSLGPFIHERYGENGVEVIVDEGNGFSSQWGSIMASPGVSEKGHINVGITVRMPGGHSSVPSDHTAIGVSAELITLIEKPQNKYKPRLTSQNPYLAHLTCGAAHSPQFPSQWKKLLGGSKKSTAKLAKAVSQVSLAVKYLMTTSVAVDTIRGGVKVNALPEEVTTVVNHRVNIGSSTAVVKKNIAIMATIIAKKYDLEVVGFDSEDTGKGSSITLSATNILEPAPLSPYDSLAYSVLSGTTRALYGEEVLVTPGLMTGNTDTRYMWPLSQNIFRFNPARGRVSRGGIDEGMGRIHTVDERQSIQGHLDAVSWFWGFIRNMDEARHPA